MRLVLQQQLKFAQEPQITQATQLAKTNRQNQYGNHSKDLACFFRIAKKKMNHIA